MLNFLSFFLPCIAIPPGIYMVLWDEPFLMYLLASLASVILWCLFHINFMWEKIDYSDWQPSDNEFEEKD
jgi:hypothetical protein